MGPHNLPLRAVPLIEIRVPVALARDVTALNDDLQLGLVAYHGSVAIDPSADCLRLPVQIMDLTRADTPEILVLRQRAAQWVDELEIVGVQLGRSCNVAGDQRTETLALRRPKPFHLWTLGSA